MSERERENCSQQGGGRERRRHSKVRGTLEDEDEV